MKRRRNKHLLVCSLMVLLCGFSVKAESLKIVFFTDAHARTEWQTPQAMLRAASAINAQDADLIIAGGDLVTDGYTSAPEVTAARWEVYRQFRKVLSAPVYEVKGNHDVVPPEEGAPDPVVSMQRVFLKETGQTNTWRSFDTNGYHIVLLDSAEPAPGTRSGYKPQIGPAQMKWLEQDLRQVGTNMPVIVALHVPVLCVMDQAQGKRTMPPARIIDNNADLITLMDPYNVLAVLQGHQHVQEAIQWHDTWYLTGGAVCGQWWRGPWHGTEEGFLVIEFQDNTVDWQYLDYGWQARRPENM